MRIYMVISGFVQGVGFRYGMKQQADELGVFGWVRNLPDGRVEAVLESEKSAVDKMIKWCYSDSLGTIGSIEKREEKSEKLDTFEIKY